jgi:hypothetical protein
MPSRSTSAVAAATRTRICGHAAPEPADAYYKRLFRDYVAAKRSLGDPIDHITELNFVGRIRTIEGEMKEKHGKPVRYRVETRGREVILIAVPLA